MLVSDGTARIFSERISKILKKCGIRQYAEYRIS